MTSNQKTSRVWLERTNIFGFVLLIVLLGVYVYQINSISGLDYKLKQSSKKVTTLKRDYQALQFSRDKFCSLTKVSKRSVDLKMVEVDSPFYLKAAGEEFAQRSY